MQTTNKKRAWERGFLLVLLISFGHTKVRWFTTAEYPWTAYVTNSHRWRGVARYYLATETLFKARLYDLAWILLLGSLVCLSLFLDSSVIFSTAPVVAEVFVAFVLLYCSKFLPFDEFFALSFVIFFGVLDLSALTFFFYGETTTRPSRLNIFISWADLPFILFHKLLFFGVFFNLFSHRIPWLEEDFSVGLKCRSTSTNASFCPSHHRSPSS